MSLLVVALPAAPAAAGVALGAVPACRVGARVTDVYDVLPASNTFSARFWLWSQCPSRDLDPLPLANYTNSTAPRISNSEVSFSAGLWYHVQLVDATFRQSFNEDDYPFDHQNLDVLLGAAQDAAHFRFLPDTADSSAAETIEVPGWRITAFTLSSYIQQYASNFGDPALAPGAPSRYSRMRLRIGLARADRVTFLKTVGPLFLIFFVISLTFAIGSDDASRFEARFATLGAALFAVLVNMQRADDTTPGRGITMIDQLHLLTMAWVMVAIALTALLWRWNTTNMTAHRITQTNRRGALTGSLLYTATAATLIITAATRG